MNIKVRPCDWGNIETSKIEALLLDTAAHVNRFLRKPFDGEIIVETALSHGLDHPKTLYRNSPSEPFPILLNVRDNYWCKYVYQFSHEFCHVLSNCEQLRGNLNNWLHEAFCELASVFVLRRMANQWLSYPSFPGRQDYANAFFDYARERLSRPETHLPLGTTLSEWLLLHEEGLRKKPVTSPEQRLNQSLVAYVLLPFFEENPQGWNTITKLPDFQGKLTDYLAKWQSSVDHEDKGMVDSIAIAFGHTNST